MRNQLLNILGCSYYYCNESSQKLQIFLSECRGYLEGNEKFLWISFQSNVLVDTSSFMIVEEFNEGYKNLKKTLLSEGWLLPNLNANMRNQKNIYNISVKGTSRSKTDACNTALERLKIGSTVVGELPTLLKIKRWPDWDERKREILNYSINLIDQQSDRNIIMLHDLNFSTRDIEYALKEVQTSKTILSYPCNGNKDQDRRSFQDFCEKKNHLLITKDKYFNGCEAPNVIYVTEGGFGVRNPLKELTNVLLLF